MSTLATKKTEAAEAPHTPYKPPEALRDHFAEFQFKRRVWTCKAPPGSTKEDLLHPEFFRQFAKSLTRHDVIFVLANDEDWEAECRVEASNADGATVSVSKVYSRRPVNQSTTMLGPDAHTAYVNGWWAVLRKSDGHAVVSGMATEAAAVTAYFKRFPQKAS